MSEKAVLQVDAPHILRWSSGDGSGAVVAVSVRPPGGGRELVGVAAGPAGALQIDWLHPESGHRLMLFRESDWKLGAEGRTKPLAELVTGRRSGLGLGGPSEEVAADVAFVALVAAWVAGLLIMCLAAALLVARRLRG